MQKTCGLSFTLNLLHPRYWFTWMGVGVGVLLSLLPVYVRHTIGGWLGRFIFYRNDKRRHVVLRNLECAFPHLNAVERQAMGIASVQWYARALLDYSLLFFRSRKVLGTYVDFEGQCYIDNAISEGRNVILLLAHSAMLDFAPAALGQKYTLYGSYKTVSNPVLNWLMTRSRCKSVAFVFSRDEGMMKLVRALTLGRVLVFLPDEDLGEKHSDFSSFFGMQKATLNTPARIAKLKKADALPCYAWYDTDSKRYKVKINPPLVGFSEENSPLSTADVLNKSLEKLILLAPEQYMWLMKIYKTRPEGEKSIY